MHEELTVLTDAVCLAGATALKMIAEGVDVRSKADGSPVTTADLAVNDLLHDAIRSRYPEDGWLSEESPDDKSRLSRKRVWIVDPIDGTRALMARVPEFCISAALVQGEEPVVAVVYNPSTDELFRAIRGRGLQLDGRPRFEGSEAGRPVLLVNPRELKAGRFDALAQDVDCRPVLSIAYALAQVAADRVAATLTFEPEHEWDLAAGVLLIHEAGGTTAHGSTQQPVRFNQPRPSYRGFLAVAPHAVHPIGDRLRRFYETHHP